MIEFKNITKIYKTGEIEFRALNNVSFKIEAGEFVAIMGPSGSGKSTLLNIIGFLDKAESGEYLLLGKNISSLNDDELSILRNHVAGFVFQQYQLLPKLTALGNAELPLIYAGKRKHTDYALEKIKNVGLGHRAEHYPNEMSGGEQQRVAIARSLVNDPLIIFADEPTGNLDTKSEAEILAILEHLNESGKTIVMVTHEDEVARHAKRIIKMRDGEIISDNRNKKFKKTNNLDYEAVLKPINQLLSKHGSFARAEFMDFIRQAVSSLVQHKLRSLLSMFGILIGVGAVISMMALGEGAKQSVSSALSSLGSNLVSIQPGFWRSGTSTAALQAGSVTRLEIQDAKLISSLDEVRATTPSVNGRVQVVYLNKNWNTNATGVDVTYEKIRSATPTLGRFFTENEVKNRSKVALVGTTVIREVFNNTNPVGKVIKLNKINFTVIGILPKRGAQGPRDNDDLIVIPYTTAMYRLLGKTYIDNIDVDIKDPSLIEHSLTSIKQAIVKRHKLTADKEDTFMVRDMTEMRNAMESTTNTITMLLASVAAISLIVGGIGVMNIMLVSVKERTKEIGLRKAIGARRMDILIQFLVEAILMTFTGGILGILLGSGISILMTAVAGWAIMVSAFSIILSTGFSILIGIGFGFYPAVQASKLSPIEALRYE